MITKHTLVHKNNNKMPKCTICKKQCSGKILIMDIKLNNLENDLCKTCFDLWVSMDYEKLKERYKDE